MIDRHGLGLLGEKLHEAIVDRVLDVHALERLAGLPCREHGRAQHDVRGELEVGRLGDDHRVLATELEERRNEMFGGGPRDEPSGLDAAGEANDIDEAEERRARAAVARNEIEHRRELGTAAMLRLSGSTNRGVTSLGLTSTAQPASSAGIASINDSVSGKFHGLITPTSGYGTSCERQVIDGWACERPSSSWISAGAWLHQRSIAAIVPPNSACASRWRPVSIVSASTISTRCASSCSCQRRSVATRRSTDSAAQPCCAARSSPTRRARSSVPEPGTRSRTGRCADSGLGSFPCLH